MSPNAVSEAPTRNTISAGIALHTLQRQAPAVTGRTNRRLFENVLEQLFRRLFKLGQVVEGPVEDVHALAVQESRILPATVQDLVDSTTGIVWIGQEACEKLEDLRHV